MGDHCIQLHVDSNSSISKQGIGLPLVWKVTPIARTCRQFRCRVATRWAAPTKMFVRRMIFPPRKEHRLLNGSSIISLGTTIVAFPAHPSCHCEYLSSHSLHVVRCNIFYSVYIKCFAYFSYWYYDVIDNDICLYITSISRTLCVQILIR